MRGVTDKLIVLSSLKYGDTSLIVKAFTYQFGVLSFMLKGVRKRRGGVVALYQPASVLEANIVYREGKSLHGINQPKHVFVAHKTTAELQRMAEPSQSESHTDGFRTQACICCASSCIPL